VRAVVYFETLKGHTRTAAENIASAMRAADVDLAVRPVDRVDLNELAAADLVVIGTWVHGLRWFGVGPAGLGKVGKFPVMTGKPAAVFCTYRWNPKRSLDTLASAVADRGGRVLEGIALQEYDLSDGVGDFVADLLVSVEA
jgi:menaquinone-dependent protoporphyrinogen IX oxidase